MLTKFEILLAYIQDYISYNTGVVLCNTHEHIIYLSYC